MTPLDLDTLTLDRGCHDSRADGVCLLEAVAWWAGEPHSDHPRCVSPVLAAFGRMLNDRLDDESRQRLVPLVPRLVGTAGDGRDEARGWLAVDWLARVQAPAWLRFLGRDDLADELEYCAPLRSIEDARAAQPVLDEARRVANRAWDAVGEVAVKAAWYDSWVVARKAARAAARNAAREAALDAALEVAWGAARAAVWTAVAVAREAAWAAADAAATDAARYAAWAAARGAMGDPATAAREAAVERLRPTVAALQESAFSLFDRMISLGEDQRTPATPAGATA